MPPPANTTVPARGGEDLPVGDGIAALIPTRIISVSVAISIAVAVTVSIAIAAIREVISAVAPEGVGLARA